MSRDLLKQCLDFISDASTFTRLDKISLQKTLIDELAKPEAEPVAYAAIPEGSGNTVFAKTEQEISLWTEFFKEKKYSILKLYDRQPRRHQAFEIVEKLTAERDALSSELDAMNKNCAGLIEDRRKLKAERDALKARIEGGVRVEILADNLELKGKVTMALFNSDKSNAVLILDEEVEL